MAALELTSSLSEIISSLDTSKIPDKLHCPVCDKFLLNGYKSSCCDQAICENCYGEVSDHCPMCEHRPFSRDLCKPYKAIRNTAKAFLKTHEKKLADERAKAAEAAAAAEPVSIPTPTENEDPDATTVSQEGVEDDLKASEPTQEGSPRNATDLPLEDQPQPSIEVADEIEVDDDNINLITEEAHPATETHASVPASSIELAAQTGDTQDDQGKDESASQMQNMQNMMSMNPMFNGMDMSQMMQMMASGGMTMNGFNPMMAMQGMAVNPMSQGMFGAFGGPGAGMNGMNGMNMGMNFPQNQGMYGAGWNSQNNNMWNGSQNNNPSDFGSNPGYGYNQHGNFNQHQYNGDFQNGAYGRGFGRGRGRGRGRGGFDRFDRGRGGFNNVPQGHQPHFQNAHEQQQYEIQNMQASMMEKQPRHSNAPASKGTNGQSLAEEASKNVDDEFAPGGQEEVQEALGGDYNNAAGDATVAAEKDFVEPAVIEASAPGVSLVAEVDAKAETVLSDRGDLAEPKPVNNITSPEMKSISSPSNKQQIAEIYQEDTHASMPPPSAPLGPAARFTEPVKDFGFRGRGHARFGSKGRGPVPITNGVPLSPAQTASGSPVSPKESKSVGVVGAPTGPKAMREPPPKAAPPAAARGNSGGGFQIMGRASMASQKGQSLASERSRSGTPPNLYNGRRSASPSSSRRPSQQSRQTSSRYDENGVADHDRDRERKHRKSKRDDEDHDMEDDQPYDRACSPGESRKSSHRSHREKDRHASSSKHHSSRSRRHEEENGGADADHAVDDYGIPTSTSKEDREHRSSKSSRHESRRDRHRDSDRDHAREERHRDRKRSRHDREEADPPEDEDERRRSRKHKTHHESNGRDSHRSSEAATPVAEASAIDPHTLEREARNKERMLKEQQRREKASKLEKGGSRRSVGGSARRVSYKYEDEVQAGLGEQERESARWR